MFHELCLLVAHICPVVPWGALYYLDGLVGIDLVDVSLGGMDIGVSQ